MESIKESFKRVAEKNGWKLYELDEVIRLDVRGESDIWPAFAKVLEDENKFIFYSLVASKVPAAKITDMAVLICEINYGLKLGNFELGIENGEVHFKTYLHFTDGCDREAMIENCVITNVLTTDEYYRTVIKLIHSN